jgi:hypothetical protein
MRPISRLPLPSPPGSTLPVEQRTSARPGVLRTARDETVEDEIGKDTQNEGHEEDGPPAPGDGQPKDEKQERRDNEKDHGC